MARRGRKDRGLVQREDASGKPVWYVRLWDQGKERWFGSFANKTQAREFYEARKLEQREGRLFPSQFQRRGQVTLEEVIEDYIAASTKKSIRDDRRYSRLWLREFPGSKIREVTPRSIEKVRQRLLDRGLAPSSTNRALAFLRHVLNLAVRDGLLAVSPMAQVKFLKESPGRLRFLSPEEETKLLEAIGPTYAPWVRLAILTGMRQAEQFGLRWEHVDLDQGIITLPTTKAGGVQYVHLNGEAKATLQAMDSWQWSLWVFPSENPRAHLDPRNFYKRVWMPAVRKAGIEWATWHDLRHTYASRLAMAGTTDYDIASLLRHSTTALVRRYAHLSPSHLKGVVEKVAAFGQTSPSRLESQPEPRLNRDSTADPLAHPVHSKTVSG